jgi:hypothetical protein
MKSYVHEDLLEARRRAALYARVRSVRPIGPRPEPVDRGAFVVAITLGALSGGFVCGLIGFMVGRAW